MNWWTDKSVAKWNPSLELSLFKNLILSGHVQKFDVAHACMHNGMLLYPNLFIRVANVMFIEYETTDPTMYSWSLCHSWMSTMAPRLVIVGFLMLISLLLVSIYSCNMNTPSNIGNPKPGGQGKCLMRFIWYAYNIIYYYYLYYLCSSSMSSLSNFYCTSAVLQARPRHSKKG